MNLWISSHLLVAGLFLSTSALIPEECQPLVTPLSLADSSINTQQTTWRTGEYALNSGSVKGHQQLFIQVFEGNADVQSKMYGRTNFIVGYTDNEVFKGILKLTESCWLNITPSSNANEAFMSQENKINGTCVGSTFNITIDGNTASASLANFSSVIHVLPSCDSCLLMSLNSTARNLDKLLDKMNFNSNVTGDKIHARALYLMTRELTLKDSDMEHFKQQASCLGFSGEPDYLYNPKNEFCAEGEGIKMTFD